MFDLNKPKKSLNLSIVQSTITTPKKTIPVVSTNVSNPVSSLVCADYESSSD